MVADPTGPHKLKHRYRAPRVKLEPEPLYRFDEIVSLLYLHGRSVDLKTARGTPFTATVETNGTGDPFIKLPWANRITKSDYGYNRRKRSNSYIGAQTLALCKWAMKFGWHLGRENQNGNRQRNPHLLPGDPVELKPEWENTEVIMGHLTAMEMANMMPLERALEWHLTANHYPPVSAALVPVAIEAIKNANDGYYEKWVKLPAGYRKEALRTGKIIAQLHLDPWITEVNP